MSRYLMVVVFVTASPHRLAVGIDVWVIWLLSENKVKVAFFGLTKTQKVSSCRSHSFCSSSAVIYLLVPWRYTRESSIYDNGCPASPNCNFVMFAVYTLNITGDIENRLGNPGFIISGFHDQQPHLWTTFLRDSTAEIVLKKKGLNCSPSNCRAWKSRGTLF